MQEFMTEHDSFCTESFREVEKCSTGPADNQNQSSGPSLNTSSLSSIGVDRDTLTALNWESRVDNAWFSAWSSWSTCDDPTRTRDCLEVRSRKCALQSASLKVSQNLSETFGRAFLPHPKCAGTRIEH